MNEQTVVVLGGTRGLGLAVAERAAREGAQVVMVSSRKASVDAAVQRTGGRGHVVDLRQAAAVRALFAELGPFDHLVYTAGEPLALGTVETLDLDRARTLFELRYWGALAAVQAAKPYVRRSIVLTSGSAATRPHPGFAIGASICGAIEALTRTLAIELAPVRVNAVAPGFVDTELWSDVPKEALEAMFREAAAKLPVGRIASAADVAEHYLSFMRGAYVTGQSLLVDGGGVLV